VWKGLKPGLREAPFGVLCAGFGGEEEAGPYFRAGNAVVSGFRKGEVVFGPEGAVL